MSDKYATVKVTEFDGKLYPLGSDTPIPENCVIVITPANHQLMLGDVIVDTYGQVWVIDDDDMNHDEGLRAFDAFDPYQSRSVTKIEAPYIVVCRQSQPTEILIEA